MDKLVVALGPAFAAGFAVQQLLEILDGFVVKIKIIGKADKKLILGIVSLIVGLVLAFGAGLRVLQPLGVTNAELFGRGHYRLDRQRRNRGLQLYHEVSGLCQRGQKRWSSREPGKGLDQRPYLKSKGNRYSGLLISRVFI